MFEGFTSAEISTIVVGGLTLIGTVITALVGYLNTKENNRAAIQAAEIGAEGKSGSHKRQYRYHKGHRSGAAPRDTWFRRDRIWIFVLAGGAFLTLICSLAFGHQAGEDLKQTLRDGPKFDRTRYGSSEYYGSIGDQSIGMGDFTRAESAYRQAVEGDDSEAAYHDGLAVSLAKQGKLEEALDENLAAVALDPDVAQYHYSKGVTLLMMAYRAQSNGEDRAAREFDKNAEEECRTAIRLEPDEAVYHDYLARILNEPDRYEEAEAECVEALRIDPDNAEYHVTYAALLILMGRYEDSLEQARTAAGLDPDYGMAYHLMSFALQELGRWDDAEAEARRSVRLDQDRPAFHNALGSILHQKGRYREALKELETTLSLHQEQGAGVYWLAIYHNNIAQDLIALGRYDEALRSIEAAIDAYSDETLWHYVRAALLTYFHRPEEAARELETAYDLAGLPLPEDARP